MAIGPFVLLGARSLPVRLGPLLQKMKNNPMHSRSAVARRHKSGRNSDRRNFVFNEYRLTRRAKQWHCAMLGLSGRAARWRAHPFPPPI